MFKKKIIAICGLLCSLFVLVGCHKTIAEDFFEYFESQQYTTCEKLFEIQIKGRTNLEIDIQNILLPTITEALNTYLGDENYLGSKSEQILDAASKYTTQNTTELTNLINTYKHFKDSRAVLVEVTNAVTKEEYKKALELLENVDSTDKINMDIEKYKDQIRYTWKIKIYKNVDLLMEQKEYTSAVEKLRVHKDWLGHEQTYQDKLTLATSARDADNLRKREELKKLQEQRKERLNQAMQDVRITTNDFDEITWYHDDKYMKNDIYISVGTKSGELPWIRLVLHHSGSYLMIESYEIKIDGKSYFIIPEKQSNVVLDVDTYISETYARKADQKDIEMLRAIVSSKKAYIRFYGYNTYSDTEITNNEKLAIQHMLSLYEALSNQ